VKKTAFVVLAIALLAFGCKGRNGSSRNSTQTQTIAPAAPEPAANGTDAMTQTVDVEDGRSVDEGAGINSTAVASDTATAVKRKTGAAATSRKTPPSQSRPAGRTQ